ncbi:NEQ044 [Nanoarchaeum equitans Kin4-M]|uniref:non-specific serine/threonine protein kinase n=1 Tax=Nanoarchaeum equitans (strain Kin4-M) TaxID=228908 RepID=Q74N67_NANEQ|nr:NEQ044 [Nanoarchaeum equitans Kin4-M]
MYTKDNPMEIARGSEGIIYLDYNDSLGIGKKPYIIKYRPPKKYRHEKIDISLRKFRLRREYKILQKAYKITNTPEPYLMDENKFIIAMQYIEGQPLNVSNFVHYLKPMALIINTLHENNIIHGDLHPKNFILGDKLYIIDFGLSFISNRVEDKAVDLYELRKLLKDRWEEFAQYYKNDEVLKRVEDIERRGRYKMQI